MRLFVIADLIALAICLGIMSCSTKGKTELSDERDYPEALFTLGELACVNIEVTEETDRKSVV